MTTFRQTVIVGVTTLLLFVVGQVALEMLPMPLGEFIPTVAAGQ